MSKELNTPGWLDDVIPAGTMTAEDYRSDLIVFTRQDVYDILTKALQRDRDERPARRPWAGVDSKSDYGAFVQWLANNHGLIFLGEVEYKTLYRLFCEAYGRPSAPGSETGDKP